MTIAEVSAKYKLTPDTLRYYERIGLLPPVGRTSGGIRDYRETDLNWIEFIKCMRSAGLPIETLIEYVRLFAEGDSTANARKELLIEQRALLQKRIDELNGTLNRLDKKIEHYENLCVPFEKKLKNK